LVSDNRRDVDRLNAVDVATRGFSDVGLVLGYPHAPIDVKGLWAHPSADELDHGVAHARRVEGSGQAGTERVEGVEVGYGFTVQVGESGS
jgi:hypothetical protein